MVQGGPFALRKPAIYLDHLIDAAGSLRHTQSHGATTHQLLDRVLPPQRIRGGAQVAVSGEA
jgi:hypothetical protein